MQIKEFQRDILTLPPSFAVAQAVSADLVMGGGLALKTRQAEPEMHPFIMECVRQGYIKPEVGGVIRWQNPTTRKVHYLLVTKKEVWQNAKSDALPSLQSMRSCLSRLRWELVNRGEQHLALPRIGCGLDKMEWDQVRPIIEETFGGIVLPGNLAICVQ